MVWKKKKFWKSIEVIKIKAEFGILLDKNLLKTPQKKDLLISNKIIADFIALSDSNLIESFSFIADFISEFMVIFSDIF